MIKEGKLEKHPKKQLMTGLAERAITRRGGGVAVWKTLNELRLLLDIGTPVCFQ